VQVAGIVIGALVIGVGYGYAKPAASSATAASKSVAQATTTPVSSATRGLPDGQGQRLDEHLDLHAGHRVRRRDGSSETVNQLQGSGSLLTAGKAGTLTTATGVSGGPTSAAGRLQPGDRAGLRRRRGRAHHDRDGALRLDQPGQGPGRGELRQPGHRLLVRRPRHRLLAYSMLNMANVDSVAASVTITMYTAGGQLAQGARRSRSRASPSCELPEERPGQRARHAEAGRPYAIHVVATSGRIAAAVLDWDGSGGGRDFIGAQKSASHAAVPRHPAGGGQREGAPDAAVPTADATVALRWVGHSTITPAVGSSFSGDLVQGKVATVDLSQVPTQGEYAALEVCGANSAAGQCLPVTGSRRRDPDRRRGQGHQSDHGGQDTAYTNPVLPLTGDGIVADNESNSVSR
jgi:hypothetical protein